MLQHLKGWWATHVSWIAVVASFLTPSINAWVAAHPGDSVLIGGAWGILLHHLQPPRNFTNGNGKQQGLGLGIIMLFLFLGLLAFPSAAHAQNPLPDRPADTLPDAPTPKVQNWTVSATATNNGGSHAVMMATGGFQLTEYYSVSYSQIWNPNDANDLKHRLGDFNGTYQLSDLLPGRIRKALVFDPSNYLVTFQGSVGKVTGIDPRTGQHVDHIEEGLGIYGSRPFNDHSKLTAGYRFLHGVNGSTWIKVPAAGFNFTF